MNSLSWEHLTPRIKLIDQCLATLRRFALDDLHVRHPSTVPDAKRNFILQQGLSEPAAAICPLQYSARCSSHG